MERKQRGGGKRNMVHSLLLTFQSQNSDLGTERGKMGQGRKSLSGLDGQQAQPNCFDCQVDVLRLSNALFLMVR